MPRPVIGYETCRVYWGTHGCELPRGHDGTCVCDCAFEPDEPGVENVGAAPYYGPDTWFYGEDAAARGLPMINDQGDTDG